MPGVTAQQCLREAGSCSAHQPRSKHTYQGHPGMRSIMRRKTLLRGGFAHTDTHLQTQITSTSCSVTDCDINGCTGQSALYFSFFLLKKKKIFQKLTQTRRNHKPNPAVLGFNHLCGFKNKMSVQLQDLQGLNISKHRKGWVVFFLQCQATLVTGFSFMIFKHAPQLFCLSNTQSYKDF